MLACDIRPNQGYWVMYISFKNLIGPELIVNEDVLKARQEFYNAIGCVVNTNICQELDVDFEKVKVEKVFLHLSNVKIVIPSQ